RWALEPPGSRSCPRPGRQELSWGAYCDLPDRAAALPPQPNLGVARRGPSRPPSTKYLPGRPDQVKGFLLRSCGIYSQISSMSAIAPVLLRITVVSLPLPLAGCAWLRPPPTPILPADELSQLGDTELDRKRFPDARENYTKIVERHPNSSYAPRARFLIGEAWYREGEFDKAVKEFETFMAFYPSHQIADLVQ